MNRRTLKVTQRGQHDLTLRQIFKLTHQGAASDWGRSLIWAIALLEIVIKTDWIMKLYTCIVIINKCIGNDWSVYYETNKMKSASCCLSVACTSFTRSSAIAEGKRDAACQLKSCQLPRNSAVQVLNKSKLWSSRVKVGRCVVNMCWVAIIVLQVS